MNWNLEWIVGIVFPILAFVISFLVFYSHWSRDARLEKEYSKCYRICQESGSFPKVYAPAPENTVITSSQGSASILRTLVKTAIIRSRREGLTVIPIPKNESEARREIEIIRKNVATLPGSLLLNRDFLSCLRNYLGYKCATLMQPCIVEVREYFKNEFEKDVTWSVKIRILDTPSHYDETSLIRTDRNNNPNRSVLNEVFLPIVCCMYTNRIVPLADPTKKIREIEESTKTLMTLLHGLCMKKVPFSCIVADIAKEHAHVLIQDVKQQNRWGYVLATNRNHFRVFLNIGLVSSETLGRYWDKTNFKCETPTGCGIGEMEYLSGAFIYFAKRKEAFKKREKDARIKGEQKFRKKEGH